MKTIFYIDDDSLIRKSIARLIGKIRPEDSVVEFDSAKAVIQHIENDPENHIPDLFVSDIEMPEINGIGLAQYVRDEYGSPIILISGNSDQYRELHPDLKILDKPIFESELREVLTESLS